MNKEEILERNRKYNTRTEEDEREQYINGKAGLTAKITFTLVVIILSMYNHYKSIPNNDVGSIFLTYCATESLYKYYYLKNKKFLLFGIFCSFSAIGELINYIFYL